MILCQQWFVTGKPVSKETNSRESRQLFFRYHFPWPGYPVHFYDNGAPKFNYGKFDPYHQERIRQEQQVNLLSSQAVQWMRNLNRNEQESLTAWTLASAAVASLTQGRYGDSLLSPPQFNGIPFQSNYFSLYG